MSVKNSLYVSSSAFKSVRDSIEFCSKNNVNLEISKFARTEILDITKQQELDEIKELLTINKNINVTFHGACFDIHPTSLDPKVVALSKDRMKESLELARFFGCNTIVFHSGYNPNVRLESYKKTFIDNQIKFWKNFIKEYNVDDIILALENTYEETPDILLKIYEGVDSSYFKSCIDVGHINTFTNYDIVYWLDKVKPYLYHFHLHNNEGYYDNHLCVTKGTLNFDDFFNTINTIEWPLQLTLEIFEKESLVNSLNHLRLEYSI